MNKILLSGVSGLAMLFAASAAFAQTTVTNTASPGATVAGSEGDGNGRGQWDVSAVTGTANTSQSATGGDYSAVANLGSVANSVTDSIGAVSGGSHITNQTNYTVQDPSNTVGDISLSGGYANGGYAKANGGYGGDGTGGDAKSVQVAVPVNVGIAGDAKNKVYNEGGDGGYGGVNAALNANVGLQAAKSKNEAEGGFAVNAFTILGKAIGGDAKAKSEAENGLGQTTGNASATGANGGKGGNAAVVAKAQGGDNYQKASAAQLAAVAAGDGYGGNANGGWAKGGNGGDASAHWNSGNIGSASFGTINGVATIAQNTGFSSSQLTAISINARTN